MAKLCGNQYSPATIEKFEEILLNKLNWNPNKVTAWEILDHLLYWITNFQNENSRSGGKDSKALKILREVLSKDEVKSKISIFNQIWILDYNLSRYGPTILSIVSVLLVLRNLGLIAELACFRYLLPRIVKSNPFTEDLEQAEWLAMDIFWIPKAEDDEEEMLLQPEENYHEVWYQLEKPEEVGDLNRSYVSDQSQSTAYKSFNSSPIPPFSHKITIEKDWQGDEFIMGDRLRRKEKIFSKKRRVICKRAL